MFWKPKTWMTCHLPVDFKPTLNKNDVHEEEWILTVWPCRPSINCWYFHLLHFINKGKFLRPSKKENNTKKVVSFFLISVRLVHHRAILNVKISSNKYVEFICPTSNPTCQIMTNLYCRAYKRSENESSNCLQPAWGWNESAFNFFGSTPFMRGISSTGI